MRLAFLAIASTPPSMGPAPSQVIPICVSASSSAGRKAIFCGYRMPMNGIDDVIGRSDLADRALFLTLPPIADHQRRVERRLWRQFEVARPRILGSLLDAAAHGLRNMAGIRLEELPRMADFALWATACETAFWPAGTFTRAYHANRRAAIEDLLTPIQ
jgi:hypothetical protein